MKRFTFILAVSMICLIGANGAFARTYAGNLDVMYDEVKVGGVQQIKYYLNDAAASVTIEVKNSGGTTIKTLTGTTARGLNTVAWDLTDTGGSPVGVGDYYFNVATTDVGYATWTNITPYQPGVVGVDVDSPTDTVVSARFWAPNGLQCNKVATDPNFGRIYVANGAANGVTSGATGAYHDQSGVYFLNCDLSDAADGFLEDVTDTLFNSASLYNPFKLNVDVERGVIVCGGYSDGWEDLYFIDLDGDSYVTAFSRADMAAGNFENCIHSAFTGTGAATKLWSNFEKDNSYPSIATWDLGGWPISATISAPFELQVDDSGAINATNGISSTCYTIRTIVVSPDENFLFFSNRRWGESRIACAKLDITGPTMPQLVADTYTWRMALLSGTDAMYGNFNSVDYGIDPVEGDRLACQRYYGPGHVFIVDPADMSLIDRFTPDPGGGGTGTTAQCVFDAAGNVLYSDLTNEWVRVYAPPSAAYNFDVDFAGTFAVVEVTGLDNEDWELYR